MLQVANHTPFTASLSVFPDPAGVETAYMIVKASFRIGAIGLELLKPQVPLLATDMFWGDPVSTSLRAVGEFGLLKPATDVLLVGRAIAPKAGTRVADVGIRVGPVSRLVRVFGDRHWTKSAGLWRPSEPKPWERMPLRWELAYGGIAPAQGDEVPEHEPRNPVGRGLVSSKGRPIDDQPLAQPGRPQALLKEPEDRPPPACFAPIAPHPGCQGAILPALMTRLGPASAPLTCLWTSTPRFFNVAPPNLVAPGAPARRRAGSLDRFFGWRASGLRTAELRAWSSSSTSTVARSRSSRSWKPC